MLRALLGLNEKIIRHLIGWNQLGLFEAGE